MIFTFSFFNSTILNKDKAKMQRFATAIIMNSSLLLFPMFVTAFGDIITWEENEFVGIVK